MVMRPRRARINKVPTTPPIIEEESGRRDNIDSIRMYIAILFIVKLVKSGRQNGQTFP